MWPWLPALALQEPPPASAEAPAPPLERAVRAWRAEDKAVGEALQRFYAQRDFEPAWFVAGELQPRAHEYLRALEQAPAQGLDPEHYQHGALEEALGQQVPPEGEAWMELELALTASFLAYAADVGTGRLSPQRLRWRTEPAEVDLAALLQEALDTEVAGVLEALQPAYAGYTRLKAALARHRAIAEEGGWPQVPGGGLLERGMRDERVAVLRERLRVTGDLPEPTEAPGPLPLGLDVAGLGLSGLEEGGVRRAARVEGDGLAPLEDTQLFDARVEEGVRRFQRRHGLAVDGLVGRRTLAALRVPVEERIAQLELNLERWRWLPEELGERHVLVNLPAYELEAVEDGQPVLRMKVAIGRDSWRTPVFQDEVEYVVLNPVWNVPSGIAAAEVLPALQRDAGAAARMGLTVVERATGRVVDPRTVDWAPLAGRDIPYRFFQKPGGANPLGRVKFIFPNRYAVYLHDTPNPAVFEAPRRAFSHGCIRVEDPLALTAFLLEGHEDWTHEALEARLGQEGAGREPLRVDLPEPVPVHLLYWTAYVDEEGRVQFREDVYGRDGRLQRALERAG